MPDDPTPPTSSSPGAASTPWIPRGPGPRRSPSAANGSSPSGATPTIARPIGPRDARHRPARPDVSPGLPGRPRPSDRRPGSSSCSATSTIAAGTTPYSQSIADYADAHPDVRVDRRAVAGTWATSRAARRAREDLDAIVPDRPAFFPNRDGHSAWVNSAPSSSPASPRDTPDPDDGRIERDPDGTPTGTLHEGAAELVERLHPAGHRTRSCSRAPSRPRRTSTARDHRLAGRDGCTPDDRPSTAAFAEPGWLTARVVGAPVVGADARRRADRGARRRSGERGSFGRFRANSVKLMLDGVLENFTGAMIEPYLDGDGRPTTNRGIELHRRRGPGRGRDPPRRRSASRRTSTPSATGRCATALDAVEAARAANGPTDTRPHIAHIQVIHPDDVPRFGPLGVVANAQPLWALPRDQMDGLTIPFLGPERADVAVPVRVAAAGGRAPGDGLRLERLDARTRCSRWRSRSPASARLRAAPPTPFLPDERLTLEEALAGVHDRLGLRQPPRRRDRHDRGRQAGRPRRPRPRPVRRRTRARSATRGSSARSSTGVAVLEELPALGGCIAAADRRMTVVHANSASHVGVARTALRRCSCCDHRTDGGAERRDRREPPRSDLSS